MGALYNVANYVLNALGNAPIGYNNCFAYMCQVRMEGSNLSTIILLIHHKVFSPEQVETMLKTAIATVIETRIVPRRKGLQIKADSNLVTTNEDYFKADVMYLEAVICDKFDFRVLKTMNATADLVRTIKTP